MPLVSGQYSLGKRGVWDTVPAVDFEGTHDCECGLSTDQEVCDTCTGVVRFFCHFCGREDLEVEQFPASVRARGLNDSGGWWPKKHRSPAGRVCHVVKPCGIKN